MPDTYGDGEVPDDEPECRHFTPAADCERVCKCSHECRWHTKEGYCVLCKCDEFVEDWDA